MEKVGNAKIKNIDPTMISGNVETIPSRIALKCLCSDILPFLLKVVRKTAMILLPSYCDIVFGIVKILKFPFILC